MMPNPIPTPRPSDGDARADKTQEVYRTTFVLRAIEGLSVSEVAACLDITTDTVKTRLHRARARLRDELCRRVRARADDIFPFHLSRCDRVVATVMGQLPLSS